MLTLLTLLVIGISSCSSSDGFPMDDIPQSWIDQLFPDPYPNTAKQDLKNSTCTVNYYLIYLSISGLECTKVPKNTTALDWKYLLLYDTVIEVIEKEAFLTWSEARELRITFNIHLREIQEGAFHGLSNVEKLTIKENRNLTYFPPKLFEGLINLKELYLLRNNVVSAKDISPVLSPKILPSLECLDLSGNAMKVIGDDDFQPMVNSSVTILTLTMIMASDVKSKAFLPFNRLEELDLGGNHLNSSVVSSIITEIKSAGIDLKVLGLRNNMLTDNTTNLLKIIASSNIRTLNLAENQFGKIDYGFFPRMPNIKYLNLSQIGIDDLPQGVIDNVVMPNLTSLSLARNLFSGVTETMMIPSLTRLDLAANAGSLINTAFIIPPKIFSNMTNLDILILSKNDIESLKKDTLSYMDKLKYLAIDGGYMHNLYNYSFEGNKELRYLDLSKNDFGGATVLTKNLFKGLDNLLALDLSHCSIHRIDSDAFVHLKKLKYLSLKYNSITSLPSRVFKENIHLKILDLSHNSISNWDKPIFGTQLNLTKVFLHNNELSSVTPTMVKDLANVSGVDMYNNHIECNCKLLNNIKTVIPERSFKYFSLFQAHDVCLHPSTNRKESISKYWESVEKTNACYVMGVQVKLGIGLGVTLLVLIIAGVTYHYFKWELIYWSYILKQQFEWCRCRKYKDKMNQETEYKFDAFISYCHEDKKFVTKMVAILEGEFGFRLCLYERDFRVGDLISESVLESVAASRMTIMVLSNSFAKSQWCLWELHIAQQRLFYRSSKPDSLIIIKLTEIDDSAMTHTLRHLMNARIYLEWHKNYNKQKVFWQQLKAAIERNK